MRCSRPNEAAPSAGSRSMTCAWNCANWPPEMMQTSRTARSSTSSRAIAGSSGDLEGARVSSRSKATSRVALTVVQYPRDYRDRMTEERPGWGAEASLTVTWNDPAPALALLGTMSGLDYLRGIASGELPPPPIAQLLGMGVRRVDDGEVVFALEPHPS